MNKKGQIGLVIVFVIVILGASIGSYALGKTNRQDNQEVNCTPTIIEKEITKEVINNCNDNRDYIIELSNQNMKNIANLSNIMNQKINEAYMEGRNSKHCGTKDKVSIPDPISNCIKGKVQVTISELSNQMGNGCTFPEWCNCADINQDGVVDASDYIILKQNFGN